MSKPLTEFPRHESTATRYFIVYAALIGLTFLTYGLSRLHLGAGNLPVVLAVALAKCLLVMLFFMHLLEEKGLSRMVMIVSVTLLVVLILFVVADVATRFPLAVMRESPDNPAVMTR